ncbi:methyltransferase domain-containing protein [uncultured Finegoldia sp.]|uniref:methyltransferase domain-containing protein n=1 Tax=uncultured Finegoldia sp. TaxID=328009 RepID=UPI002621575D|nr:methyltransferase domain-containing protein [uncultured Finegoldia sp.]
MSKQYTDEEIRQQVKKFYDNIAQGKTTTKVKSIDLYKSLGYDTKLLQQLPEEISSGLSCGNPLDNLVLKDTDTLLDLGCGMGLDVFMARIKYPNSNTIYGMDRLKSMIEKAEKVRDKKGFKKIEFVQGELIKMPFEDNSIDKIISNCVINLEPNKLQVYREIHRILKPNGMFIISDITLKKPLTKEIMSLDNIYGS